MHLDLVRHGVIADPFERMNEIGCQWVDQCDWSYRTTFQWAPDDLLPHRVLRFEGLDTVCEIVLNGEVVATSDNMFVPLDVEVGEKLREGSNELLVNFRSAVKVGLERKAKYFETEGLGEHIGRFDERAFVRKAQYMYGWDWGPRLVSCGIWRPVSLLEFKARVLDVHVTQNHANDGSVSVRADTTLDGDIEGIQIRHRMLLGQDIAEGQETPIEELEMWSARAQPTLYTLQTWLECEGQEVDYHETVVGLSQVRLVQEPDRFGQSFEFEINGRRIWARGANWIPDHSFPSVVSRTRYREQLERAVEMGYNMLRVWGGGLYETDDFYEICDELGILVWQDFPFACSYYPDDEHWQDVVRKEAEVNIRRLRNHPCLALWCGNNENLVMFASKWGGADTNPDYYYGEKLYDEVLPNAVKTLDPGRSYIASSPIGAPQAEGKYANPNADGYGDQHMWDVWHGRGDWRHYADSATRFSSEFGFAASCSASLWAKTLDEEDWSPQSPAVRWHDKTGKGQEKFRSYVELHYPVSQTLEDWVYYSQLNQRDALRFGVEHWRRSEYCKGTLVWQMNDCWPVQSWAMLDFDGNFKASAYESSRLYSPLLVSIVREHDVVTLWAVNDSDRTYSGKALLVATHLETGEILSQCEEEASVEPGERKPVLQSSVSGLPVPVTLLLAKFKYAQTWQLLAEPKAARFAPPEPILVSTYAGSSLEFRHSTPVVDLMFTSEGATLPFEQNFVTRSQPGKSWVPLKSRPESIEARSLAGIHPIVLTRSPI